MTPTDLDRKARELLAAELEANSRTFTARQVRSGDDVSVMVYSALRAITAALRLAVPDGGWVRCEDRLPGPCDHVEVYPSQDDNTYNFYAHYDGGSNGVKAGRWYHNDQHGDDYEIRVTHWRPRSEPAAAPTLADEGEL